MQYSTVQYSTEQCSTIQYTTIQYNTIQYNTIQYNTIQYNTIQYTTIQYNTYRKSYERECISWFMGTSDVLKVLKIARAVTINHEMHEQVHTIFYLLYSQPNYSHTLLCRRYVLHQTLQWFPICSHVLFEPIKNIMLWQGNQAWSFWRVLKKIRKYLES